MRTTAAAAARCPGCRCSRSPRPLVEDAATAAARARIPDEFVAKDASMRAMVLDAPHGALALRDVPRPAAAAGHVVIAVEACAVCRTDLHLAHGELEDIPYPLIPGHQIIGTVVETRSERLAEGTRVGLSWLGSACGACGYCRSGRENLCDAARFTGYTLAGGYAELVAADARFCLPLRTDAPAAKLAPLLCAGAIGYRALTFCGVAERIGLFGFGAAAYLLAQTLR